MPSTHPILPFRSCLAALACVLAAAPLGAQKPGKRPLPHLPAGHPAQVRTWHLVYEIEFRVEGRENKTIESYEQKLDFHAKVTLAGEVDLVGPTLGAPPERPKNTAEAMQAMLRRISWQSTLRKPVPGKVPFAQHRHPVDYRVGTRSWLRTKSEPVGGEDTEREETEFERKLAGEGKAQLVVVGELVFDTATNTYDLYLGFTDDKHEQPLAVTTERRVERSDHNGSDPPEVERTKGKLPLAKVLSGACESDSWTGQRLLLRGRDLPEGAPQSFTVAFEESMTKVADELCPVVLQEPAEWLAKNKKHAIVAVKCTLTRKD